jgi:signal peptide peptidase SppA
MKRKMQALLARLVLDGGSRILALDETWLARGAIAGEAARMAETNAVRAPTSVAVLPLKGPLASRGAWGMEGFRAALATAAANPDVGAIVLDIDSPGGTFAGTQETADAVRAAAAAKPVTACVADLCASAAYWIASAAGQIVVSPGGDVGSIGVLCVHMDMSRMLEEFGLTPTIIRSVPFKAEGNPYEPLSPEAIANLQGEVDQAHGAFVKAVAAGRKVSVAKVQADFGRGRTMMAQNAVYAGMADRVGTLADVLAGVRTRHAFRRRSALAFA